MENEMKYSRIKDYLKTLAPRCGNCKYKKSGCKQNAGVCLSWKLNEDIIESL